MITSYKIDFDDTKFLKQLGRFQNKLPSIARKMLGKVSSEIRKTSRNRYLKGGLLKKRTGNLYKKIKYKTTKNFSAYITASAYYASFLIKGADIEATKHKYLTFKIGEEWKKVKKVNIPAKPFLKPVIDEYFSSSKAVDIMDIVLQKEIDKLIEKERLQ